MRMEHIICVILMFKLFPINQHTFLSEHRTYISILTGNRISFAYKVIAHVMAIFQMFDVDL